MVTNDDKIVFERIGTTLKQRWSEDFLTGLLDMVKIPSVSPAFAPDWEAEGHIETIVQYAKSWLDSQGDPDLSTAISRLPNRTPLLHATLPGSSPDSPHVLLYGHLDKQPGGDGWTQTAGPWHPEVKGGYVYGRGSSDDVYSLFAMWGAIATAKASGYRFPRCTLLLECSEESSSCDLPAHLDALSFEQPDLVMCLDAFSPDYSRLWATTSLRGIVVVDIHISTLTRTMHSGDAGGILISSFGILRQLLDRIEDPVTGFVRVPELNTAVPASGMNTLSEMSESGLPAPFTALPVLDGVRYNPAEVQKQFLQRGWGPSVSYVGIDGLPPTTAAASVILPDVTVRLSVRIPPNLDAETAGEALRRTLLEKPPVGADVRVTIIAAESGWVSSELPATIEEVLERTSQRNFGDSVGHFASGVTIPFMGMLGKRFPDSAVLTMGALGPDSNPHAPDESLKLDIVEKFTASVAEILLAAGKG